jgi:hypothetical protein
MRISSISYRETKRFRLIPAKLEVTELFTMIHWLKRLWLIEYEKELKDYLK